jgi:hypothetical protein
MPTTVADSPTDALSPRKIRCPSADCPGHHLEAAARLTRATVVVPMDFLRVPLTALAGWLVYAERVDLFTVAGVMLILAGNLLNLRRPARARAAAVP